MQRHTPCRHGGGSAPRQARRRPSRYRHRNGAQRLLPRTDRHNPQSHALAGTPYRGSHDPLPHCRRQPELAPTSAQIERMERFPRRTWACPMTCSFHHAQQRGDCTAHRSSPGHGARGGSVLRRAHVARVREPARDQARDVFSHLGSPAARCPQRPHRGIRRPVHHGARLPQDRFLARRLLAKVIPARCSTKASS